MPPVSSDAAVGWRYRFDGVELDLVARRLRIDGEDRASSQRALQLLEILCEQPGVLLSRNQLIDRLWPGGQVVSDEALTQIIFRTRAVLGPYAERLATVRGAGLRLDAQVRREAVAAGDVTPLPVTASPSSPASGQYDARADVPVAEAAAVLEAVDTRLASADATPFEGADPQARTQRPAAAPESIRLAAAPSPAATRSRMSRRTLWLVLALLACVVAALVWQRADVPGDAPIDTGYGLDAGDAHASHPQTVALLRDAFRQEAGGDRERARALLEAVHDSDATTPIPALFLGLWSIGAGDLVRADAWLAQARARIATLPNPNIIALLHYIEAERESDARAVVRHAGAVLDQRPHAWQMRTARAHLLLTMDMDDAALDELQQVEVTAFTHRKLAMAVADRASLGDVAGAQAVLDRAQDSLDVPEREFLRGRIAWSRGDLSAAQAAFEAAVEAGRRRARFALLQRATLYVGLLQMLQGRTEAAIDAFEQAHASALQSNAVFDQFDIGLLLAELRAELGDGAMAREQLAAVLAVANATPDAQSDGYLALFLARLAPDLLPADPGVRDDEALALLAARRALHEGRKPDAEAALDQAIARGALDGVLADETRLLQAELGRVPAAEIRIDPPFPPLSRYASRHALARFLAGSASTSN